MSSVPSHLIPRTPRSHVSHSHVSRSPASSAAVYEPQELNRVVSTYDSEPHPRRERDSVCFRSERLPSLDEQRSMLIRENARQQRENERQQQAQADLERRIAEQLANERRGYLPSRSTSSEQYSPAPIDGVPSELRTADFMIGNNRSARDSRDYFSSHPSSPSRPVSADSSRSLNSADRRELETLRREQQDRQDGRRSPSLPSSGRSLNSVERAELNRLRAEEARWLETQSSSTVRQDDVRHWVESQQR